MLGINDSGNNDFLSLKPFPLRTTMYPFSKSTSLTLSLNNSEILNPAPY
ncbi:MAG: hypothetical protein BWY82_00273 [Verrucomicrobia bacterium ADurb.Bin474]|nr:MAG: hypothetical protein BWY82_00273 [Verrucomicrobia bacterium ADurb.Bin474]